MHFISFIHLSMHFISVLRQSLVLTIKSRRFQSYTLQTSNCDWLLFCFKRPLRSFFLFVQLTIDALKQLLKFINSEKFVAQYKNLYINLAKINQDFAELFFSCQQQMCGGTLKVTAYVYGYNNNNSLTCLRLSQMSDEKTSERV